jgi:hypothetical protein
MVANKRKILVGTTIFVSLACAGVAEAQLYSWRDGKGKMNYGSVCPAGATCRIKLSTGGWKTVTPQPSTTSTTTSGSTSTTGSTTTTGSTSTTGQEITAAVATLAWDLVVNPNLVGNQRFSLAGLNRGRRYYFVATAQDTMGNESGYSNEVFKDIP